MADVKISDMSSAASINSGDYVELSQNISGTQTSTKATIGNIAAAVKGINFVDLTGTLSVEATSVTISNAAITTTSTIDIYTDVFGVNPTNVTVTTGQIVLTFEAQESAVNVKVRVS